MWIRCIFEICVRSVSGLISTISSIEVSDSSSISYRLYSLGKTPRSWMQSGALGTLPSKSSLCTACKHCFLQYPPYHMPVLISTYCSSFVTLFHWYICRGVIYFGNSVVPLLDHNTVVTCKIRVPTRLSMLNVM